MSKAICPTYREQTELNFLGRKVVVTDVVKSNESGLHELATGHENEATMVFGPLPKIDR